MANLASVKHVYGVEFNGELGSVNETNGFKMR
jgi:hypothetical protein